MYNYPADLLPNNLYNPLFKLPLFLFNRPAEGSKSDLRVLGEKSSYSNISCFDSLNILTN